MEERFTRGEDVDHDCSPGRRRRLRCRFDRRACRFVGGCRAFHFGTWCDGALVWHCSRQTLESYRGLFSALKFLAERDLRAGRKAEWRLGLKAVYAKATLDDKSAERYRDELYELFANNLYDKDDSQVELGDQVAFEIDDPDAPHWPIVIPFDPNLPNLTQCECRAS